MDSMGSRVREHHGKITALADAIGRNLRPQSEAVLLHGDLNAGNLLVGKDGLMATDPIPAIGEPEQDIGEAAAKNNWGPDLRVRAKNLADACHADQAKVVAYTRLAAWNAGLFHAGTGAEAPGRIDPDELLEYAVRESA